MDIKTLTQDEIYVSAVAQFGAALARLACGYERDADRARDLLQEIHLDLWRSLARYEGRASLRTWVYRIAHCVAAKHIYRDRRARLGEMVDLEEALTTETSVSEIESTERGDLMGRLMELIHQLQPMDRQIMLLYLDDLDATAIGEIAGLTSGAVATRIHRIKALLAKRFNCKETA
ncbi:MAG TPA: RNA polymerase sigma factor [Steroidobacteraceae bacterium]|nr:RNA polymerase sigma factor [Steroidobacteraceae bacterium]